MANKRMFTMKIVDSDAFLDMPLSTQCLYFHLNMRADDDGFIGNPKRIMRLIGSNDDDLKLLIAKRFILVFDNGVIVIKHWRMHNTLSKHRYHETQYLDEKETLKIKDNGSYSLTKGKPVNDSHLLEMFDRRTSGEQAENADLDLGLDKDIDIDLKIEKENIKERSLSFDAEKAWNDTFYLYPKKSSAVMAKNVWMDKLLGVIEPNRKEVAKLIYHATKMYLNDYDKNNPEDENHRYIPKYCDWLVNDCDYWISEVEKNQRGDDG